MITGCDFLIGSDTLVMVLPDRLPPGANTYTVHATPNEIRIKADYNEVARFSYNNPDVFNTLAGTNQIGLVENPPNEAFPGYITNLAYVTTARPS